MRRTHKRVGAEQIRDIIVPVLVLKQPVVCCIVDNDSQRVLPGGDEENGNGVNQNTLSDYSLFLLNS